nr:MAG TPA: hypothetical protein [Caudoviricetes sp.]
MLIPLCCLCHPLEEFTRSITSNSQLFHSSFYILQLLIKWC